MRAHRNVSWNLPVPKLDNWEQVGVAVLMDIREELQSLNAVLHCRNFLMIPSKLDKIVKQTRPAALIPRASKAARRRVAR